MQIHKDPTIRFSPGMSRKDSALKKKTQNIMRMKMIVIMSNNDNNNNHNSNSTCNYDYYFVGLRPSVIFCKTAPTLLVVAICLEVHLHNEDPS